MSSEFAAAAVDAAVRRPVLVYGSLPPHGRDLDLLVRPDERAALHASLPAAGFASVGDTFVRLRADGVDVVDLRTTQGWGLPADEVEALFAAALPLSGRAHLVRPAPAHALLVLARRLVTGDGGLDDARRARLEAAVAEDPLAWDRAAEHAAAWGATTALTLLRAARPPSRHDRMRALQERQRAAGRSRLRASVAARRAVTARPGRGRVVAVCGLDGAGKSTQARALVEALEACGHPAVAQWTRLSYDPVLDRVGTLAKRALRAVKRSPGGARPAAELDVHPSRVSRPDQRLRQSSPLLTAAWALVVATSNGVTQRRRTREHLRAGRTVVCDRWTLDSAVHLRYRYGESRRFSVQVAAIGLLSPRPVRTIFLDVPADAAYARKDDHYDVEQLRRQQALYEQEHRRLGARRLDGERPAHELTREVLLDVLPVLRRRRRLLRR